ncbi:MAG: FtsX-like permease family protein, partial [Muribaculaceae bacterium]|nr:FtsX-like permease family protein [Muribaculaceae bacterium]
ADPIGKAIKWEHRDGPTNNLIVTGIFEPLEHTLFKTGKKIDMIMRFENNTYINNFLIDEHMRNATGATVFLMAKEGADLRDNGEKYRQFFRPFFWYFSKDYDPDNATRIEMVPFSEIYFSGVACWNGVFTTGNRQLVMILIATGLVILIFAILNYINLTVAQSGSRAKEMATRRLMGGSRDSIIGMLIAESGMLVAISAAIGIVLSILAEPYASSLLSTKINLLDSANVLTVSLFITVLIITTLLAGIIPAVIISSSKPIEVVRGTFRRRSKMVFSKVFIVIQNFITIVMIACSIIAYSQTRHLINAPLGYNTKDIVMLGGLGNLSSPMKTELEKLSCVEKISFCNGTPFGGGSNNTMNLGDKVISWQMIFADDAFFDVFDIKVDTIDRVQSDFYFNRQALRDFDLDESADYIPCPMYGMDQLPIGGIVSDFNLQSILDQQHPIMIVKDNNIEYPWDVVIKIKGYKAEAWQQIDDVYGKLSPGYSLSQFFGYPFLEQKIEQQYARDRSTANIVGVFTLIAIIISMLGQVAMSTYFVQQRATEIAVRKVMGSSSAEVLRQLVRTFLTYVAIAFVLAIPAIYYLGNKWLADYSYRISLSWWIYAAAGSVCLIVALVSVLIQSTRAANANPVKSLYQN